MSTIWAGSMYALFIVVGVKHSIAFLLCIVAVVTFFSCLAFGATPVAEDDSVTIDEDISILIDVLANDSDPDGDTLTIASVTVPGHGITSIESSKVRYTPDPDYCGTDSFSYTMTDGIDTDTAEVRITITWINDTPIAVGDLETTRQEKPVSFRLQAADVDVDPYLPDQHPLVFQILSSPAHGEISVDLTAVTYELPHTAYVNVTYTPEAGFTGNDRITFSVTDPFGVSDTAKIQISVHEREVGSLSGMWATSITLKGQPFQVGALSSTLVEVYKLGKFKVQMSTTWEKQSFSSLSFSTEFSPWGPDNSEIYPCL